MDEETQDTCSECGRNLNDSRDFKNLRAERDTLASERDDLRTKLLERTIKDAGFDPTLGVVKRLAKEFDGDIGAADAFAEFATAEGLTPTAATTTMTDTTPEGETARTKTDVEQQLDTLHGRADQLRTASTTTQPADLHTQIAELEAAGKWTEAGRLKRQLQTAAN